MWCMHHVCVSRLQVKGEQKDYLNSRCPLGGGGINFQGGGGPPPPERNPG